MLHIDWFWGAKPQRTGLEGQWQETHQIVQHPHEGLELVLPQPTLLHGPEGASCPLHRSHLMRPMLLLLQQDEVLHTPCTGQSGHLWQRAESRQLTYGCVCTPTTLYTSLLLCITENGDQGRLETEISGKLSCIWFFPPRGKLLQTCRACVPISKEEVLVFLSQCQFLGRHSTG